MNGNTILVYLGSTMIAGTTTNDIETSADLNEKSSPATGEWREFEAGKKEWKVTVDYLMATNSAIVGSQAAALKDLLLIGHSYTLKFMPRNGSSSNGVAGTAILQRCRIKATRGNLVQGTFAFVGSGTLG